MQPIISMEITVRVAAVAIFVDRVGAPTMAA